MRILVDADACPVNDIVLKVAKKYNIEVIFVTDTAHMFYFDDAETIIVDKGKDSVDFALINRTQKGDIVVTQDYGVAAMALSKQAYAINQNGLIYSDKNMDRLLMNRHISMQIRKAGGRAGNPKKRTKENNEKFEHQLIKLYNQIINS